jgi:tetratricopeptide (TPR) repeat protein
LGFPVRAAFSLSEGLQPLSSKLGPLVFSLALLCQATVRADVSSTAAQYYFDHREYAQSLALWEAIYKRQPENVEALCRVAELKLLLEGRVQSRDTIVEFLKQHSQLRAEEKEAIRSRFERIQSFFLTDEGQTAFLQAKTRVERKDYQGALAALERSMALERGNVKVLKVKANCERSLGLWESFSQTAKQAFENDPFDPDVVGDMTDAFTYRSQYPKVIELFQSNPELLSSVRNRTAYAVAMAESGSVSTAVPLLQTLVEKGKSNAIAPILWFELGSVLAKRRDTTAEATNYLEQFIRSVPTSLVGISSSGPSGEASWDPYRTGERRSEAERLLASLREDIKKE